MCCTTTIFINAPRMGGCCRGSYPGFFAPGAFSPGCFGFGYSCMSPANYALMGAGMGLGLAAGMALPSIFKGIGSAGKWVWNNALVPAGKAIGQGASWFYNKALVPAWNGVKSVFSSIRKGVSNLWHKVFKKKSSKTETS